MARRAGPGYRAPMKDNITPGQATVHYGDGEFVVLKPGRYVTCAVTERPIPLEILRYWSPERQEAYIGPVEALSRMGPID